MTASMINSPGMAHGGYIFLLAESVFAHACNSHGPVAVASGADLTFVAPPMTGMSSRRPPRSARLGSRATTVGYDDRKWRQQSPEHGL
ncbi:hotdog domain-containing protein [Streptomyces sp. NPDC020125]|uniref:hotdog domain-containing protein n=1 Tax=Streptomyces sp. NPDC020125 TaxID=3154593 RepID=UPI0033F48472